MSKILKVILFSALVFLLFITACGRQQQFGGDAAQATALANQLTGLPSATGTPAAGITSSPAIPLTGAGRAEILCQFCVEQVPHAVLVLPQNATFSLVSSDGSRIAPSAQLSCNPMEVLNGKQVVMCYGQSGTPITLQVCTDASNCVQVPIKLTNCPGAQAPSPDTASTRPAPGLTQTALPPPGGTTPTLGPILPTPTISP